MCRGFGRVSIRFASLLLALAFASSFARAQRYSFPIRSEAQGLTDLGLNTLLQDQHGFIWVGTNNGLFRYDGHRFLRFGMTEGLPADAISAMLETHDGTLWVATEAGLSRREGNRFIPVGSGGIPPERGPETIAEDTIHGGIYLATSRGLLRISRSGKNDWMSGTAGAVWSVFTGPDGTTWYAQTPRICSVGVAERCYNSSAGVSPGPWGGLVVDREGTVWARSAQKLIALEPGKTAFVRRDAGLPYAIGIGALSVDSFGNLLVPTGDGLAIRKGSGWMMVGREAGLIVPSVSWAISDREGSIWIASRGGGLSCWLGAGEWQNWTTQQGLRSDEIWAITRDEHGRLLVATTFGVSMLDGNRFRPVIEIGRQLSRDRVLTVLTDHEDAIWIGASPSGLFRYDRRTGALRHFDERDGIAPETIYSLALARDGALWAGGLQGLYRGTKVNGRWMFAKEQISSGHNAEYFNQILLDRSERLWAAGSEGLALWRGGAWTRIMLDGARLGRLGGRLAEAPDGAIWFAAKETSDLFRLSQQGQGWRVDRLPLSQQLAPQVTYFLGFDRAGNLWRGTGLGVYELAGGHWVQYTHVDGLAWDDTDANAFYADSDNSVWLGTTGGLSHHLPAQSAMPATPAEIIAVRAGDRILDQPHDCRLEYRKGRLTIEYAALMFRHAKDIRFRYRLQGLDTGWTETPGWEAHYTSLPPGSYTFEVESGTSNAGWSGKPASMTLVIVGPWWRSRRAVAGGAGVLIALLFLFWRYGETEHRRRENELAIAVQQRTEELQAERTREQRSNTILEMIASNQPLGSILDAIGRLACLQATATAFCFVLRRGESEAIVSAHGLSRECQAALTVSGAIPFEAWRLPVLAGSAAEPLWSPLILRLAGGAPEFITSRLIGSPGAPLGLMLVFSGAPHSAAAPANLDSVVRLASIAIEHATMYEDLRHQAMHDALTGLPNRLRLEQCLEFAIRESAAGQRKFALLYVDLDRFKEINDTFSHRAGDHYLRTISDRMKKAVRAGDIVGRIGGDEFNVILPLLAGRDAAEEVAARILEEIRRPVVIEGREICGTASLGIALYPDDALDADGLQRCADAAMYCAKGAGKNRVQSCNEGDTGRIEQDLRSAIAEGWIRIDYQPKVTHSGAICGLEALVRLDHPVRGEMPPSKFIPVAEQTGLIVPLGAWVLNESCRQIASWRRRGLVPVPVAVNVSSVQVCRDDFAVSVKDILDRNRVEPELIELELTESFLLTGGESAKRQMDVLRGLGIRISLDDFGSGYSSFSYLRRLDVDAIKLDRSFVQSIETDPGARRLIRAMVGIAEGLGLDVIGEGVETEEQRTALIEAGCRVMQGYLFARPKRAAEIEVLLHLASDSPGSLADLDRILSAAPVA